MMVMLDALADFCAVVVYLFAAGVICVGLMFIGELVWNKIRKHR